MPIDLCPRRCARVSRNSAPVPKNIEAGGSMGRQFPAFVRGFFSAALAVCFLCVLMAGRCYGQVEKATLSGTVTDPSGGVIVGAKIEAKDVSTGVTYSGVTDAQGRYTLPEMQVGSYDVSAQETGFEKVLQTGIVLSVGARPILDFKLPVGRSEQVVQVEGEASRVDTDTATVGTLIAPNQMENLPSNGRNFTDLLSLAPGVATVPSSGGGGGQSPTVYGEQTNYSVSGSRPVGLAYLLDNTDITDALDHGAGVSVEGTSLGMEAIQEFSVLTNTYSAEFGGTGAAVNAVTKSGTNDFHGSAYEYIRNSVLDAKNYFDAPGQKPTFKRNQFGGSLGGPIKTDKAFFFVNYEGLRSGTGETSRAIVPTSLPDLFEAGGMTYNGTTWVGPYGPISPLTESIFGLYPLAQTAAQCPNVTDIQFLPATGLFCSHDLQIGNEDYVLGRVDYTLGAQDSLFAQYHIERAYQILPYVYTPVPGYPEVDNEHNQYLTVEERHTFSPRLLNEARFGYVRLYAETANGGGSGGPLQSAPGLQDMDFSPGQNLSSLGPSPTSPSRPVTNRFSAGDDVVLSLGAHSLRFGATVTRVELNQYWDQYPGGAWIFADLSGNTVPGTPLGGSLYGDPLLCVCGAAPSYSYTTASGQTYPFNPYRYWRQTWLDPYIQDDWKITKRLTLNIGLRYDWASNPTTAREPVFVINNLTSPTTTENSFVTAKHPFTSNPNKWNFDPRIGLAWDLFGDHKTSVRAGFGMFHEPVTARTYALDNTSFLPNAPLFFLFFDTGFPALPSSPNQMIGGAPASSSIAWYYAILQNVDTAPYVMQYNLNVQRELGHGTVLTVGYNGSSGNHLFFWADANPPLSYSMLTPSEQTAALATGNYPSATGVGAPGTPTNPFTVNPATGSVHVNPNFQAVEAVQPRAHSSYNAVQVTLSRQFARSLVGNAGYTYSKCLDDASATISTEQGEWAVVDAYNPSLDRGPCSFSSNQVFTANAIYRLPFQGNRLKDGWQISPIVSAYSGLPFNVQTMFGGLYQSQTGGATEGERPEVVPGCNPMVREHSEWWNPECYVFAPFGSLGDSIRDSLNNPNFVNFDFAIFKDTRLTEKVTMQLRAEFFDILNHPNFVIGNQVYLMGTAGTVSPSSAGTNYAQLSNPAAYLPETAASPGGVFCNPSQKLGAPVVGPCYTPSTAFAATMPGTNGGQREIQFALRFMF
jgi:Carboxypeptidase regulatory-like domain/TonB dependent receptor/TonB-dependent Receptor Plug Domain